MQATYGALTVFALLTFCALMAWIYTIANKNELKKHEDEIYQQSANLHNEEKAAPASRTQTLLQQDTRNIEATSSRWTQTHEGRPYKRSRRNLPGYSRTGRNN